MERQDILFLMTRIDTEKPKKIRAILTETPALHTIVILMTSRLHQDDNCRWIRQRLIFVIEYK